jgi:SAM-dependent methyltransferase
VAEGYRLLGRVNQLLRVADPFQRALPRWLGEARCRQLSILDLGAGDGSLAEELSLWAAQRGWNWRFTCVDINPLALALGRKHARVAASATALPFADDSFDLVTATQMTHHLADEAEVVRHFREAWRVTRDAVFLNDVHRNAGLYTTIWLLLCALGCPKHFREDGLISVRRGWRVAEWRELARQAGISAPQVWLYYGSKVLLQARKQPEPPVPS